jgi:hypothetical protein
VFKLIGAAGLILVISGVVVLAGASGDLDRRMPNQVLPRRLAVYPLAAGVGLSIVAGVGLLFP